jgi:hypothetical protein
MTTVNKSIYPPPPPFYQLYTHPPPPPPPPSGDDDAPAASTWPLDIYSPPPPLDEAFLKFGELQSAGYEAHELPPDVPPLYVTRADADSTRPSTASSAVASPSDAQDVVDYSLSLRLLNRQYLQRYLSLLSSLVPPAGSVLSAASPTSNPAEHLEARLKDLAEISANFALLLTRIRPHQANQTLLQVVMKQIERRKKKKEKVERSVQGTTQTRNESNAVFALRPVC